MLFQIQRLRTVPNKPATPFIHQLRLTNSFVQPPYQHQRVILLPVGSRYFSSSKAPTALTPSQLQSSLSSLSSWQLSSSSSSSSSHLSRSFLFPDFSVCWSFMSRIALLAEKMNHHPDWTNVYNTIDIRLSTHDAKGITSNDISMAKAIDEYYATATSGSPAKK